MEEGEEDEEYWYENFTISDVGQIYDCRLIDASSHEKGRYGLLDSGASRTVCGQDWLDSRLPSGQEAQLHTSDRKFRFGDGRIVASKGSIMPTAQSPMQTGACNVDSVTDIAPGAVPLLISLEVMRTLGMCLDIKMKKMWVSTVSFPLISLSLVVFFGS